MKNRWKPIFALLLSMALVAAACGGGSDDASSSDGDDAATSGDDSSDGDDAASEDDDAMEDDGDAMDDVSETPGEGVTVVAARANWDTGYMQGAVFAAMLEELGYEVTDPAQAEFPPGNGYVAMAEGELDFWANSWMPAHMSWFENELTDGSLVGDNLLVLGELMPNSAIEGFVITKSVADENNITSLDQINGDPELVALFDSDGNGLAEIFGCPEDWTCDDIAQATIDRNGWTNIEQTKAGYAGMIAETLNRVNADEPAIQYTWSPSGYLAQLIPGDNVMWLSLGGEDFVCDGVAPCDEAWTYSATGPIALGSTCTDDPCWTGWSSADIQVTANREFAEANPAAAKLFEVAKISVIDAVNYHVRYQNGEDTEDDVKAIAAEWIADNRDRVDEWLHEARAAA